MKKELLTESRRALRFLHNAMQFDFQREHIILKKEGRFTYNTVCKEIEKYISGKYAAAVLIKRERPYQNDRELYCVRVGQGRFNVERFDNLAYYHNNIDYFFTVGDFEEARKSQTAHYYIVAQSVDNLAQPKTEKSVDLSQRFRYLPYDYEKRGDGRGNTYIGEIHLMRLDGTALPFKYKPYEGVYYPEEIKVSSVPEVIDHSGYIVLERRRELKRRAKALRAERKRAAARVADFSEKEKAIAEKTEKVKQALAAAVLSCTTYDEARKIDDAASTFRWAMLKLDSHKERISGSRYDSPESIERALIDIEDALGKVFAELEEAAE